MHLTLTYTEYNRTYLTSKWNPYIMFKFRDNIARFVNRYRPKLVVAEQLDLRSIMSDLVVHI
jgi:hypothetical protein